ncbi:MAG: DNA polymerase III subunit alpha [Leadbetterella sp.]
MKFSHLHNHTQFSLLDGASNIKKLFQKAQDDGMPAMAITDHGNMFGAFEFVATASKFNVKPIVGCEFYVVEDHTRKSFSKEVKDIRYHQLLLAKNAEGYKNLSKLCSLGYIEGLYGKYPRVTKALIEKYKEGLIATTCCIGASVPKTILKKGEEEGEIEFQWWLDRFGEDFYVEIQRHEIPEQMVVNDVLLRFAKKYNVKVIASNDSHYVDQQDWVAHDILLCVNTNEKLSTPSAKDFNDDDSLSSRDTRFAFFNDQFYFKSTAEMSQLFADIPAAIDNTNEIVGKIETLNLKKDILLPNFPIPEEFKIHTEDTLNQWEYLKHVTYEGARKRYGELDSNVTERIDFELFTIRTMGFAGYFLIVMDFIAAGRNMGVMIGPGRGSAAGSVVAYCIGITNIDPIKYNLLFERFLNPDRKSMPDIDTDFEDDGRQKVIDYVVDKYGKSQVAQIITYGTMATKSAIKDVARVMEYPLADTNALTKLIPDKPAYGIDFNKLIHYPETGEKSLASLGMSPEEVENVRKVRDAYNSTQLEGKVLKQAEKLEGTVRNTGVHAAGIIIAPYDLSEIVPVSTIKDSDLLITQYQGSVIEDAGVIKMDFLGLRNLSIIKETLNILRKNRGIEIDIDTIPLDDAKTFELFQKGETNAIFQFESDGMKKYLKDLVPDKFEDLIAMNALYRPGPIAYIPTFINRKHGREEIKYDLAEMEEYLQDTYGVTVYQEQVMLLSQKLGNFTKGDADTLRKAMGKKQKDVLDKMKSKFMEGTAANGFDAKVCEKVWVDWEAFAQYAFNKSHSTCYAFVAYQTAYLKSHYPSEYMAAVLTSSLGNLDKITFFMEECKAQGLVVLGPDINESDKQFSVNKTGQIRFGLGGIKGTGDAAVDSIIEERAARGEFKDVFDFITRVNLRTVNKKTIESLVYAGALDCFDELHRAMYFEVTENASYIEKLIRYANKVSEDKSNAQNSLFGDIQGAGGFQVVHPKLDKVEPWSEFDKLKYEKEVVGFYISGHPLDQFAVEMQAMVPLADLLETANEGRNVQIGGIVTSINIRTNKSGNQFGIYRIDDYSNSIEFALFGKDFQQLGSKFYQGMFASIKGKIETDFRGSGLVFRPTSVDLLSEVKRTLYKEVKLKVNLRSIGDEMIESLLTTIEENPGSYTLKMQVIDALEQLELSMFSRSYKVDISQKVKKQLTEYLGEENVIFS